MRDVVNDSEARPPIVSLGMPVYNGEKFIAAAIRSILNQSFRDFELVICDNASIDRTEEICRAFAAEDPRVSYYRNPTNLGAHPNFNLCCSRSRGRYFRWAAHDDLLHAHYLKACVAGLDANPDAALCQTDLEFIDEADRTIGVVQWELTGAGATSTARRFATMVLHRHNCYDVMGLFRRELLPATPLPSFHGADRALLARMATRGRFIHVYEPLMRVRDFPGRYTRSKTRPSERARWHDTRNTGRLSFPHWRLYGTYWGIIREMPATIAERARASLTLLAWWFVNWNAARMAVDLVATVAPGAVGFAERVKQRLFSTAPGIDEIRRS